MNGGIETSFPFFCWCLIFRGGGVLSPVSTRAVDGLDESKEKNENQEETFFCLLGRVRIHQKRCHRRRAHTNARLGSLSVQGLLGLAGSLLQRRSHNNIAQ